MDVGLPTCRNCLEFWRTVRPKKKRSLLRRHLRCELLQIGSKMVSFPDSAKRYGSLRRERLAEREVR